jgi:hypothetical protein
MIHDEAADPQRHCRPLGRAGPIASDAHATMVRAWIAGLIIVAAIVGIAVFADSEHRSRANRATVQEANN